METGYAKILEQVGEKVTIQVAHDFSPTDFFKNRDGLYVDSDFKTRILNKIPSDTPDRECSLLPWKLLMSANDATIESALPEKHIFSESDVSVIIADLIGKQPEGSDGILLNDGSWNLFYTPEFVVGVGWISDSRYWFVSAWFRRGSVWREGGRVFAPAN